MKRKLINCLKSPKATCMANKPQSANWKVSWKRTGKPAGEENLWVNIYMCIAMRVPGHFLSTSKYLLTSQVLKNTFEDQYDHLSLLNQSVSCLSGLWQVVVSRVFFPFESSALFTLGEPHLFSKCNEQLQCETMKNRNEHRLKRVNFSNRFRFGEHHGFPRSASFCSCLAITAIS